MSHRVDKVASQLREEISDILVRRINDPRVGFISVVAVDVAPDLSNARVKVSSLGSEEEREAAVQALDHASGFIRRELRVRLREMRRIPELRFIDDRNIEYATHIGEVIEQLKATEHRDD
jgi:ribosome-binding factor A